MNPIERIPQKEPFLFIDTVLDRTEDAIVTEKVLTGKEDFFQGHFPGNPVMPGVLLCEACFQSAALLLSYKGDGLENKTAVVSRIQNAKFKQMVKPNDTLNIRVELKELMGNAAFMKGVITVENKKALIVEFAVTLVDQT